ncbi:cysteine-rich venom protein 6-like [Anopheles maculipalpis]|uniref:cysteine-rich venom protein 6-like n=1 Tax=Anopheles maculipalpis TaxID=1496333 RepID=UPI002158B31C|nr:cysteine-rich venom protein 6-like [Anopheles maculipalpis]
MKVFVVVMLGMVLLTGAAFADESEEKQNSSPESGEVNCAVEKCNGQYEEYKCCGKCYQETCQGTKIDCEKKCTKGCYCIKGFIREYEGGKCMPKRLCQIYLRRGFNSG